MDILMVMDGASSGKLFYGKKGLVGSTLAKIDVKEDYIELVYQFLKINEKYITQIFVQCKQGKTNFIYKINKILTIAQNILKGEFIWIIYLIYQEK